MHTPSGTRKANRPAAIIAMLVVGIVALFQTAVVVVGVIAGRDAAHILDISGLQRGRSQQLAYLAISATSPYPEPNLRSRTEAVIGEMMAARAEIRREPQYATGPTDRNGLTALGRLIKSYFGAVRELERHPHDRRALTAVREGRLKVFTAYDRAVKMRVGIINAQNERILAALFLGIALQLASMVGAWFAIVAPAERRAKTLLSEVRSAREEIESTFDENPDGISVYDRDGYLARANRTRAQFIGKSPSELVGLHYSQVVEPAFVEPTREAFERALSGETVHFDSRLLADDGKTVDIAVAIFPRTIGNEVIGVNIMSRDMRELRAAEAAYVEQNRRLSDLYEIASAYGKTTEELLSSAIELVTARLGYDFGVVTEIVGEDVMVVSVFGEPEGIVVGDLRPLRTSLAQLALAAKDAYQANDFRKTPHAGPLGEAHPWGGVSGMKIFVGGVLYGTVGFASRNVRDADLSDGDIGFMRLACALLGTIIERGRQMHRLDLLAFSDPLTGLPNRARFASCLATSIKADVPFALHYIDLDRFKAINDRFGHATGDLVLRISAQRLLQCTRENDVVVRLGGDEFAIIQAGPVDLERAISVANRLVNALSHPVHADGVNYEIGASIGIAMYPSDAGDAESLVREADAALYAAKDRGRRGYASAQSLRLMERTP